MITLLQYLNSDVRIIPAAEVVPAVVITARAVNHNKKKFAYLILSCGGGGGDVWPLSVIGRRQSGTRRATAAGDRTWDESRALPSGAAKGHATVAVDAHTRDAKKWVKRRKKINK